MAVAVTSPNNLELQVLAEVNVPLVVAVTLSQKDAHTAYSNALSKLRQKIHLISP